MIECNPVRRPNASRTNLSARAHRHRAALEFAARDAGEQLSRRACRGRPTAARRAAKVLGLTLTATIARPAHTAGPSRTRYPSAPPIAPASAPDHVVADALSVAATAAWSVHHRRRARWRVGRQRSLAMVRPRPRALAMAAPAVARVRSGMVASQCAFGCRSVALSATGFRRIPRFVKCAVSSFAHRAGLDVQDLFALIAAARARTHLPYESKRCA